MDQLMPEGIAGLHDLPYPLFDAIRSALVYIGFDELAEDERPPRSMWHRGDKLREWFDEVRARRARRASGRDDDIEDPVDNAAAAGLVSG